MAGKTVEHSGLWEALAAFQAELPVIEKTQSAKIPTKTGPGFSYEYADLSDVTSKVLPLLGKHGLSWTCTTALLESGQFVMRYRLSHSVSEDSIEGVYPLPGPNTPAQAMGSAITYARRYSLLLATGVAPGGEDDDGIAAHRIEPQANYTQAPTPVIEEASDKPVNVNQATWDAIKQTAAALGQTREKVFDLAKFLGFQGGFIADLDQGTADKIIEYMLDKLEEKESSK